MKTIFSAAVLLLVCTSAHANDNSVRDAALATLKDAYTYNAPAPAPATAETEPSNPRTNPDIIHMVPVRITGSREQIDLSRDFDHKAELKAARAFSLKNGGLIFTKQFGKIEADFGVWVSLVPPRNPAALPILRVDFLNLRW